MFIEKQLNEFTSLSYSLHVEELERPIYSTILMIKFVGEYGSGSAGNSDADYMSSIIEVANSIFSPDALIINLECLDYDWGDKLLKVFNHPSSFSGSENNCFSVVVGDGCENAVVSLLDDACVEADEMQEMLFRDLDTAHTQMISRLNKGHEDFRSNSELKTSENDKKFWDLLGDECGPDLCQVNGCSRLKIRSSVLCRVHHYERYHRNPCPFTQIA